MVIHGEATCEVDGVESVLRPGLSFDVPLGAQHRLSNKSVDELVIVEVSSVVTPARMTSLSL